MMKINIAPLRKDLGRNQAFSFHTSAEQLGLEDQAEVWPGSILIEGSVTNKGSIYEINGIINATISQNCSRCLEATSITLAIPFSEEYREVDSVEANGFAEQELNYFNSDEIDITDLVRENILLAEPIKPVCSESCRGLCPECGANLNINTCGCSPKKTDPRLAVLEKLLSKD
jgi:uncharacterized protein